MADDAEWTRDVLRDLQQTLRDLGQRMDASERGCAEERKSHALRLARIEQMQLMAFASAGVAGSVFTVAAQYILHIHIG